MSLPDSVSILIVLTFLLAGFVKGVIGLGLPTVAVGLLGLVMAPAQAAALLVVPSLVTNLWQLFAGPAFLPVLRRLWLMLLGICFGSWLGAGLLTGAHSGHATVALGIALAVYAAIGLSQVRFSVPARWETMLTPLVGTLTGLVTGATGVFVIPAVPYLQALGLGKDDLIQALGLSFTISTIALAGGLLAQGAFAISIGQTAVIALLPAVAGMLIGQWVRGRVRPEVFRLCFFLGLLVLGADLALRGLF